MTQYISSQVIYTKVLSTDGNSSSHAPFHMSEVFNKSGDSTMPVLLTAGQRNKLNIQPYLFALSDLRAGPDLALSPACCTASIRDLCTITSFFNNLIYLTY